MNRVLTFAILLLASGTIVKPQWIAQSCPTTSGIRAVSFSDHSHGWCVGSSLTLRTTDGGLTWVELPQPMANTNLNDVFMLDTLTGWIVGDRGTILNRYWKPGTVGIQWHKQPSGVNHELYGVFFLDAKRGWTCGSTGAILATTNGGQSWIEQNRESDAWKAFNDIHFTDSLNGWAVGWVSVKTTDGGNTWVDVSLPSEEEMRSVHFTDRNHGVIVGRLGTILHTSNAGATWQSVWSNTGIMLTEVDFVDSLEGWAVGGGIHDGNTWLDSARILHTKDGGLTWTQQASPLDKWITGLSVVDRQHAWIVGNGGTILRYYSPTSVSDQQAQSELEDTNYTDYDLLGRVIIDNGQGVRLRYWHVSSRTRLLFGP